ncbi:11928_t:CDS:1, partial [Gigaspora rosea]
HKKVGQCRFKESCFRNSLLTKEVLEELWDKRAVLDWNLCKIIIQSIIRAFRHPKSQKSRIAQLNKKILALREQRARIGANRQLDTQLEELKVQIGEETALLSKK